MAFSPSGAISGTAQTGLATPTYTVSADTAPSATGKQYAVTALGGTQTNVRTHSVSDPFTATMFRPVSFKQLGAPDPSTGFYYRVGKNSWKLITRKGVIPAANQPAQTMLVNTEFDVPAGADSYDSVNVRAACSFHFGLLSNQSAGIGDSLVTGIL